MKLVFATGNIGKLREASEILGEGFELVSLEQVGITEDIPETAMTLHENALQKARYVYDKCGCACFADDTGLEVEALKGEPGVFSARYAGPQKDSSANMQLVLQKMKGESKRQACFRTVIAYIDSTGKEWLFEGRVDGTIIEHPTGSKGFGYDPIFTLNGYEQTFAELPLSIKNAIGHRGKAMQKFLDFLNKV